MSKINNVGLDQYGAKPFEQQQFGTAGVETVDWVKYTVKIHDQKKQNNPAKTKQITATHSLCCGISVNLAF